MEKGGGVGEGGVEVCVAEVLQEESWCIKQEQSICPLVIIEHIGAAAELFNACQSTAPRVSGPQQQYAGD